MIPYNVNTEQYLTSEEFINITSFIQQIKSSRIINLYAKYPSYQIKPRCSHTKIDTYHLTSHNVPFFDIVCETLLYKNKNSYLELNEFIFQANCFAKTIFHRRWWADQLQSDRDFFLDFVWDDWKSTQPHDKFDQLENIASSYFKSSNNLLDYFINFVYNPNYYFITIEEGRELFDELVESNIFLSKSNDLYQVIDNVEFDDINADTKSKLNNISRLDLLHIQSNYRIKTLPALKKIRSKFNFIPMNDTSKKFKGEVVEVKVGNSVQFIPQFLFFYNSIDR